MRRRCLLRRKRCGGRRRPKRGRRMAGRARERAAYLYPRLAVAGPVRWLRAAFIEARDAAAGVAAGQPAREAPADADSWSEPHADRRQSRDHLRRTADRVRAARARCGGGWRWPCRARCWRTTGISAMRSRSAKRPAFPAGSALLSAADGAVQRVSAAAGGGISSPALRTRARPWIAGFNVLVFPEGTRSAEGKLARFRPGIGLLVEAVRRTGAAGGHSRAGRAEDRAGGAGFGPAASRSAWDSPCACRPRRAKATLQRACTPRSSGCWRTEAGQRRQEAEI